MEGSRRGLALAAGVVVAGVLFATCMALGLARPAAWTAAVTGLCAVWWVLEPIPIPATSLIPFAAFPLTGVLDHGSVANAYGDSLILLLLGGFVISTGLERSGAHRRLALGMVRLVGGRGGRRLVLGFMLATAAASMWISNSATALMMLPVALAIVERDESGQLGAPLVLGIAYAASIGGLGTPIGTPPNVIFLGVYRATTGTEISFAKWLTLGIPAVVVLLPIAWAVLTRRLRTDTPLVVPHPGPWRPAEKRILAVFGVTALAWITRTEPFGGWSGWLDVRGVGDATVALAASVALFLIPSGEKSGALLDWESANRLPWGLLILFGGGIAIAKAFEASGLATALGAALSGIGSLPTIAMIALVCLVVTFLTEVTSNTATTTLLMPVLAAAAIGAGIEPALMMAPAALSASCAFMLPVATAPNAIVFATGQLTVRRMATEGVWVNLLGAAGLTIVCHVVLSRW